MDAVTRSVRWGIRRSDRNRNDGMSMIEVMVALAILAAGLLAMLTLQIQAIKQGQRGRHSTDAAQVAQDQMELLQTQPWAAIAPVGWTAPVAQTVTNPVQVAGVQAANVAAANQQFNVSWRITAFPGAAAELRQIDVSVTWNEPDDPPGMPPRRYAISAVRHDDPGMP